MGVAGGSSSPGGNMGRGGGGGGLGPGIPVGSVQPAPADTPSLPGLRSEGDPRSSARFQSTHAFGRSLLGLTSFKDLVALLKRYAIDLMSKSTIGGLQVAGIETGSFSVSTANVTFGTGGSAIGRYTFVGGPSVGDVGVLSCVITLTCGNPGAVFAAGGVRVNLPPGFSLVSELGNANIGMFRENAITGTLGHLWITASLTSPTMMVATAGTAYTNQAHMDTAYPAPNGHVYDIEFTVMASRV